MADVLEPRQRAGGLDRAEAQRRAQRWGPNRLPDPRQSLFVRIFKHFDDVLITSCSPLRCSRRSSKWIDFWVILEVLRSSAP